MGSIKKASEPSAEAAGRWSMREGDVKTLREAYPIPGRLFAERYLVADLLAVGSFSCIYRVSDVQGRPCVLKALRPDVIDDPVASMRFYREIDILRALRGVDGIVPCLAFGEYYEVPYLVSEDVGGTDLNTPDWPSIPLLQGLEALHRVAQVAAGLHARGIVHRDLKPANLLRGRDGRVFIIDFGSATAPASITRLRSIERSLNGTSGYLSPEQANLEPADPRDDQWSLGAMLFSCVTKDRLSLFAQKTEQGVIDETRDRQYRIPPLSCSNEVAALIRRCLAPYRSERYADMRELAEQIRVAMAALGGA